MTQEEKAKAYDEAVEIISDYYQKIKYSSISNDTTDREVLERAFPQLKENSDEKIRNRIIALVNAHGQGMYKDKMLAWLEKQGEQKPQRIVSAEAKEAGYDTPKPELTEFEKAVRDIITSELCNNFGDVSFGVSISDDEANMIAKKLLPVARKQFIEEACEWLKENIYYRVCEQGDMLVFPTAEFIKDFRKALEKGESV